MRSFQSIKTALAVIVLGGLAPLVQAQPNVNFVVDCYSRFLHRPADGYGINYWVSQLHCGGSPLSVQAGILGSDEYWCAHGGSPQGFVVGLYNDVLGRQPRPDEVYLWTTRFLGCGDRVKLGCEFLSAAQLELGIRAAQVPQVIACPLVAPVQPGAGYVPQPTYSIPQQPTYSQPPGYYTPGVPSQELNLGVQTTRVTTRRVDPRLYVAPPQTGRGSYNYPRYQ